MIPALHHFAEFEPDRPGNIYRDLLKPTMRSMTGTCVPEELSIGAMLHVNVHCMQAMLGCNTTCNPKFSLAICVEFG